MVSLSVSSTSKLLTENNLLKLNTTFPFITPRSLRNGRCPINHIKRKLLEQGFGGDEVMI